MPIPHEVSKQFFIPSEDLPFMGNDLSIDNNDSIEQRINDLFVLFNLFDRAFGRQNNNEGINGSTNNENTENQNDNSESSETINENRSNASNESTTDQNQMNESSNDTDLRQLNLLRMELLELRQRMQNHRYLLLLME